MVDVKHVYVVRGNTDTTEGRGGLVDREEFESVEDAYNCTQSGKYGVMGSKDAEIVDRRYVEVDGEKFYAKEDVKIYGYRRDWAGKFGSGWMSDVYPPTDDPEFEEFLRLKKKFEK